MKTNNVFLFAAFFAVILVSASCSSDEDVIKEEEEVTPTLGENVKAQFTISIPMKSKSNSTRMSQATVQYAEDVTTFRGINQIKIFPSAVLPTEFNTSSLLGTNISLQWVLVPTYTSAVSNYIPTSTLVNNNNSIVYKDVHLQIGTRTFLFYGKAIGKSANESMESYTTPDYFKYGHLIVTGLDGNPTNVSNFNFNLKEIATATNSNTKRSAICTYLKSIADAETENSEKWSTTTNVGYSQLYNSFIGMHAGSSTNLQVAVKDLYFALKDDNNALPQAICTAINNTDYVTIDTDAGTLTFKDNIAGYPNTSDNLPDGAARLSFNPATDVFSYVESGNNFTEMNVNALTSYVYPANLYYWGKSGVLTSKSSQAEHYTSTMTWDNNSSTGIFPHYTDDNAIQSETRSVLLTEPIQYGVGRLDISVCKGASVTQFPDNGTGVNAHLVTPSDIKLTGVLIGGQKNVGWDFTPVDGTEYVIYDNILESQKPSEGDFDGLTLSTGLTDYIAHTLVLETPGKVGDTEESVNVALEFVNNGADFIGADGIVATGTKFYLVGALDVSKVEVTERDKTDGKVFKQDYKTLAQFTILNLKKAQNTIPDLRNPNVELGLSVNLTWEEGIIFSHTFD